MCSYIELRSPSYGIDGSQTVLFEGPSLMTNEELTRWLNSENGGKSLTWNNYFQEISDNVNGKGSKKYKG